MKIQDYIFVYGTLRKTQNHAMHQVLIQYAKPAGEGTFCGKLYLLGAYPAAVPSHNQNDVIHGEIYLVTDKTRLFRKLDSYEGPAFRREKHLVTLSDGSRRNAWIYLYNRSITGYVPIASGDYFQFQRFKE